jgi:hypothetical protein
LITTIAQNATTMPLFDDHHTSMALRGDLPPCLATMPLFDYHHMTSIFTTMSLWVYPTDAMLVSVCV